MNVELDCGVAASRLCEMIRAHFPCIRSSSRQCVFLSPIKASGGRRCVDLKCCVAIEARGRRESSEAALLTLLRGIGRKARREHDVVAIAGDYRYDK